MRENWTGNYDGLTDWLGKTMDGDDPELGDITVPSILEISNAPAGTLHGLAPVSVNIMGNNTTSDVESALYERMEQILDRYPHVHRATLRITPRVQSPEGGLGPGGDPFILKLERIRRGQMIPTSSGEPEVTTTKAPPETPIYPVHGKDVAFDRDPVLSSLIQLVEGTTSNANRASMREGTMGEKLIAFLGENSRTHSEELRAARGDILTMLTLSGERQQSLIREVATAQATLAAERVATAAAERTWDMERTRLETQVESLEGDLDVSRQELSEVTTEAADAVRIGDGFKRRALTAERELAGLTERYNKLLKDWKKMKKAAVGSEDGLGGVLSMAQQFLGQKESAAGAEGGGASATTAPKPAPEPEEEEEMDPDADLLEQPPLIGVIRPVGKVPSKKKHVMMKRPTPKPVVKKVQPAPTPTPAAPTGGFDITALVNATPEQVAMVFQMLPAKTRKGALAKLAVTNPDLASSVKSDLAEALGEDEEEEDGLDALFDEEEEGSEEEGEEGSEDEEGEEEEVDEEEVDGDEEVEIDSEEEGEEE